MRSRPRPQQDAGSLRARRASARIGWWILLLLFSTLVSSTIAIGGALALEYTRSKDADSHRTFVVLGLFSVADRISGVEFVDLQDGQHQKTMQRHYVERNAGWPLTMFVQRAERLYPGFANVESREPRGQGLLGGLRITGEGPSRMVIPVYPSILGIVVNTLTVMCATKLAIFAVRRVARKKRDQRGVCMKCAYPVRDLLRCPECGRLVDCNLGREGSS